MFWPSNTDNHNAYAEGQLTGVLGARKERVSSETLFALLRPQKYFIVRQQLKVAKHRP